MFNLMQIQQLLQEKQQLLLHFEEVTQRMLLCSTEELQAQVFERERTMDLVNSLDQRMAVLSEETPERPFLISLLNGCADIENLPESVKPLYNEALKIRSILSRLQETDIQAAIRLRLEQEKILEKIKMANQGSSAKAAKFYSSSATRNTSGKIGNA